MKTALQDKLSSYVNALRPIIYINHFDHHLADELIASVADGAKCYTFHQFRHICEQGKAFCRGQFACWIFGKSACFS